MTWLEEEAEKYALLAGSWPQPRKDGKPITFENIKAVAEGTAKLGFKAGARAAIDKYKQDINKVRAVLNAAKDVAWAFKSISQPEIDALKDALNAMEAEE